jgi:hypothetical protein
MSLLATPTVALPAPTGVIARYVGSVAGSTNYYYWIQAIYPSGRSVLSSSAKATGAAALSSPNAQNLIEWNPMAGAIGYNVFVTSTSTAPTSGTAFLGSVTQTAFTDNGSVTATSSYVTVDGVRTARAYYDFAVDGGAVSTITPTQSDTIPANAILLGGVINSTTAVTSGGSATVAVGLSAGGSTTTILTATAKASLSLDAVIISPVAATPVKTTAAGAITITVATAALTAGVIEVIVTYVLPVNA